ncbi:hypothetical protein NHQ30_008956 [Ciborinia camelliae]|nr:hypothetical protein NHQ30_008956 [Ciborinia camelliae]
MEDFLDWQQTMLMSINATAYAPVTTSSTTTMTACSFETIFYNKASFGSSVSVVSNIVCKCNRNEELGPIYAESSTNTTSWCDSVTPVPNGFTKLLVSNGYPVPLPTVPSTTSTPSSTSTALQSPTSEVILLWSYPPVTGPVTYDAYLVPLGYRRDLNTDCTGAIILDNNLIQVLQHVPDPILSQLQLSTENSPRPQLTLKACLVDDQQGV